MILERLLVMLLGFTGDCLLYFGSALPVLTTDPYIETIVLDSVFGAHTRDWSSCVALRH